MEHPDPHERFFALRKAMCQSFDIPWTAISPRLQRLIYAVNAIARLADGTILHPQFPEEFR